VSAEPRPGRLARWLLRAPVALYAARAGWLLGHRFLLLRHRGRRSHRLYGTVLEVVAWRPAEREAVVVSGLGRRSQWYRNLLVALRPRDQAATSTPRDPIRLPDASTRPG
jgi:hypothetical protein